MNVQEVQRRIATLNRVTAPRVTTSRVTPAMPQNAPGRIWPVRANAFASQCAVITSMTSNPARLARQLHCVQSWIDYGLPVITVNTREELAALYLPHGVKGLASDDIATLYDRPVPRVSALINAGIETGKPFFLLNADVEINGHTSVIRESLANPDKLTIGVRWNYSADDEPTAEQWGLDCFGMTPELARTLPDMPFGIGKPFWDYWLPCHFMALGVRFHWIRQPFFFHQSHNVLWSTDEWCKGCHALHEQYGVELYETSDEFRESLNAW